MQTSYWARSISRRRLIKGAATAGAGVAALSILSCGGGGGEEQARRGIISVPEDTTKQAKRGGVYAAFHNFDETNIDPLSTTRGGQGYAVPAFQKILREKEVVGGSKAQVFEGDAAESYELVDGGLTLVAKLRPNNRFDSRPPTAGRIMNAQDVVYSWDTLVERSTYASVMAYKKDPAVAVESVRAVDDRTVVYKMAYPWSVLLEVMAAGPHNIAPIEAEDKFNPKNTARGSGPWMLDYEPSVSYHWKRNPGYFRSDVPYMEGYDEPILLEYAAQLAQFHAKRIWDFQPNPADLSQAVLDSPQAKAYEMGIGFPPAQSVANLLIIFSGQPSNPFRDVRLRRAASMAIDRPLYADVFSEAERLESFGLPPSIYANNFIPANLADFWLDPHGKQIGEAGQFYKFNPGESRKLLAAAGYSNGLDVSGWVANRSHGAGRPAEVLMEMLRDAGMRGTYQTVDLQSVWLPQVFANRGDWDGHLTFGSGGVGFGPATGLQKNYHPTGGTTRISWRGEPWDEDHKKIAELIEKALRELDPERNRALVYDIQRALSMHMGSIPVSFDSSIFSLVQPWVKNWNVWRFARADTELRHVWIDESLKT